MYPFVDIPLVVHDGIVTPPFVVTSHHFTSFCIIFSLVQEKLSEMEFIEDLETLEEMFEQHKVGG